MKLRGAAAAAALVLLAAHARAGGPAPKAGWRDEEDCRELRFRNVETRRYDLGQQIVSGTLIHTGDAPVKNVRVCGNGACIVVEEGTEMKAGESAEFVLNVPNLNAVVLAVSCSVLGSD